MFLISALDGSGRIHAPAELPLVQEQVLLNMRTARTRVGVDTLEEINICALSEIKHPFSAVYSEHNHNPH